MYVLPEKTRNGRVKTNAGCCEKSVGVERAGGKCGVIAAEATALADYTRTEREREKTRDVRSRPFSLPTACAQDDYGR
jgi:hypothetical protein